MTTSTTLRCRPVLLVATAALALVLPFAGPAAAADTTSPDTTITAPKAGSTVSAPVSVQGGATDDVGVTAVQVAVRDRVTGSWWTGTGWQSALKWLGATVATPGATATTYAYSFAPVDGSGSYRATARAKDAAGNVDTTRPAVDFTVGGGSLPVYQGTLAGPGLADITPVDVAAGPSRYYVLDVARYRIAAVDPSTRTVVDEVGGQRSSDTGDLAAARSIAVDSAGNVYVADTPNARVTKYDADLNYVTQFGSKGTNAGQFTQVYGLAIGTGKRGDGTLGEIVYAVDGDGRISKWTLGGSYIGSFGSGVALNQPRMAEVNSATNELFVVNARDRQVVVLDVHGAEVRRFGSAGSGDGQFKGDPRGIAISGDGGTVFVSDEGNHRVQVFDRFGAYRYSIKGSSGTDAYLVDARGLDVTGEGVLVVTDEWDWALKEWTWTTTAATFERRVFGTPAPVGGVNAPRGLAVDGSGRVYVSDWWNQRIQRFDADGSGVIAAGFRGTTSEPGSINFAWDLAVQPGTGRIFLANRESHEIEVFDADLRYVTRWGKRGTGDGRFAFPHGVAFDPTNGTLLVTDSGNGRVQRFSIDSGGNGTFVGKYGATGTSAGQFKVPTGIDVAADGTIWVADTRNHRIQKRNPSTGSWTVYTSPTSTAGSTTFSVPWGVSVAPDGSIWVADSGRGRIVKTDSAMNQVFALSGSDLGAGPLKSPYEIEFGSDGLVYVSDTFNNRVITLRE